MWNCHGIRPFYTTPNSCYFVTISITSTFEHILKTIHQSNMIKHKVKVEEKKTPQNYNRCPSKQNTCVDTCLLGSASKTPYLVLLADPNKNVSTHDFSCVIQKQNKKEM